MRIEPIVFNTDLFKSFSQYMDMVEERKKRILASMGVPENLIGEPDKGNNFDQYA